ncbi:hypothetical protein AAFO90_21730 [Phaeobacter sp. CAU 1743]|uniref:hypothetical protein n=1 Tax=Phaeobacter sp. CAU 1743 TaxID=3140367 RepID=UPI0023B3836E
MTAIEGFYRAEFMTPEHHGFGVLAIANGTARGGDSIMSYVGSCDCSGGDVTLDLEVCRHSHLGNMQPIFKTDCCTLCITGKQIEGGRIAGTGHSPEAPDIPFKLILTKLRD